LWSDLVKSHFDPCINVPESDLHTVLHSKYSPGGRYPHGGSWHQKRNASRREPSAGRFRSNIWGDIRKSAAQIHKDQHFHNNFPCYLSLASRHSAHETNKETVFLYQTRGILWLPEKIDEIFYCRFYWKFYLNENTRAMEKSECSIANNV